MSSRHTVRRDKSMHFGLWLVFHNNGDVRMSRGEPSLSASERAMYVNAALPLSLWQTPQLRASLTVNDPGNAGAIETKIELAAEALKQAIGCDVVLNIVPQGGSNG
jgi:hypothetical protein